MGRDEEKLEKTQKELAAKFKEIKVWTVKFDFSTLCTIESVELLEATLKANVLDKNVSILVNNVGCAYFG
jgi:short-subunit dehydrogenase